MNHLTERQLEAILSGENSEAEHVAECETCRARLAEMRAVRSRVRRAFEGLQAPEGLKERIRGRIAGATERGAARPAVRPVRRFGLRHWALPAALAAAVLLVAIPAAIFFWSTEPAVAATEELYRIHQRSISPDNELLTDADPKQLAEYLKTELGFRPAVPRLGMGMKLRGCCIAHFRDKPVGSYVVQTSKGVISVIVVRQPIDSLGMTETVRHGDHTYRAGSFAMCNMAALETGGYTYCAVGAAPYRLLAELLSQLV